MPNLFLSGLIGAEIDEREQMANPLFRVIDDPTAQILCFSVPVTIDTMEIDDLITAVMASIEPKSSARWVVDLTEVAYMGSSMLGLMVNIRERIKKSSGKLALCCMSPALLKVFQACCLERLFTIAKTRDEAVKVVTR